MKKLALSIAIVLGMTLGATAQYSGGLFQRGFVSEEAYNRTTGNESPLSLPISHGSSNDVQAPLGSGIAVLMGLSAACLVGKRHKQD